ncbi:1,3-beta-glucanosyltransferase [Mycena vulgaris]|nr:1,3-beta-glucanosyltransferase [Mycena vulgaris]
MVNFLGLATTALLASVSVRALSKVSRTGKYLFTEDGNRFFIKGIAYQTQGRDFFFLPSTYVDNLADNAACTRDLPFFQKLGINAIRAYSVNSSLSHDACMSMLSGAGIYVILDLTLPLNGSVDTSLPAWSTNTLDQYLRTIDAFEKYDNILAYNIGNEVMSPIATQAAPFIMAAARDIRAYLNSISSSALVGYAAIDGPAHFVDSTADFLACDRSANSATASIDIFGLNNYEWCGDMANTTFNGLNTRFADYDVAAYFSEFGSENCNPTPRLWTEISYHVQRPHDRRLVRRARFQLFRGYKQGHEFGMAVVSADNSSITTNADFDNLAAKYNAVTFVNSPTKASADGARTDRVPHDRRGRCGPCPTRCRRRQTTSACGCLASALSCVFQPPTPDYMVLVGNLIGVACGLTGVYGRLAMCDPTIKLSYVFSQYYELNHRVTVACSFSGNATINSAAPSSGAAAAATSCIANPSAVFTPPAPPVLLPVAPPTASANSSANSTGGGSKGGAMALAGGRGAWAGLGVVLGCVLASALWTLL